MILIDDRPSRLGEVQQMLLEGRIINPLTVVAGAAEALALLRRAELPPDRWLLLVPCDRPGPAGAEALSALAALRADPPWRALRMVALVSSSEEARRPPAPFDGALARPLGFLSFMALLADLGRRWQFLENLPELEVLSPARPRPAPMHTPTPPP